MAKRDIYSTMVLVFVCLALALVPDTHGMPTGVSADACDTLTPDYINPTTGVRYTPQTGDTPYVLTVQPKSYTPGQVITGNIHNYYSEKFLYHVTTFRKSGKSGWRRFQSYLGRYVDWGFQSALDFVGFP